MARDKNSRKVQFQLEGFLRKSQAIYKDTGFLNKLARSTANQIKKRTQLKRGVSESGQLNNIKGLKESYIDVRTKNRSRLDPNTTPARSNLTATGQMLNNLQGKYKNRSIEIDFKKEERSASLTGQKSSVKNSEIVGFQEEQGRRFFDLSDSEINGLRREIANRIRKLLEK